MRRCAIVLLLAGCTPMPDPSPPASPIVTAPAATYDHVASSSEGSFEVAFSFDPPEIPLNEPFGATVRVSGSEGAPVTGTFAIDARMPEHRHGMLRLPEVIADGGGLYRVRGLLFHMPGLWEVHFDLTSDGVTERAIWEVELE